MNSCFPEKHWDNVIQYRVSLIIGMTNTRMDLKLFYFIALWDMDRRNQVRCNSREFQIAKARFVVLFLHVDIISFILGVVFLLHIQGIV